MTEQTLNHPVARPKPRLFLPWVIVAVWLAAILTLSRGGAFVIGGSSLPFALATAAMVPPLVYLLAYRLLSEVRGWVAGVDFGLIVGAQAFRVVGVVFLVLWGLGQLPSVFALTAGIGDVLVGVFALTALHAFERRAAGWQRQARLLVTVGLADFVAAFGTGILSGEGYPLQFAGEPLPLLVQSLPLSIIPTFGVPLFIILHLMAWQKLRDQM